MRRKTNKQVIPCFLKACTVGGEEALVALVRGKRDIESIAPAHVHCQRVYCVQAQSQPQQEPGLGHSQKARQTEFRPEKNGEEMNRINTIKNRSIRLTAYQVVLTSCDEVASDGARQRVARDRHAWSQVGSEEVTAKPEELVKYTNQLQYSTMRNA